MSLRSSSMIVLEPHEPLSRLLLIQFGKELFAHAAVVVDSLDGQVAISAIPGVRDSLAIAGHRLESWSIGSPAENQKAGPGKIEGIAPDRGQAGVGLVDKVIQVVLPASVKIAEEE